MSATDKILFFKEDVSFRLTGMKMLRPWITKMFGKNNLKIQTLNYIFCSDKYLLKLNKEYLSHNYFTDIITFDNSEEKGTIEADVFISIDRVRANAKEYKTSFNDELHRVMIHGALHLTGLKDKSEKDQKKMREAEDFWLRKISKNN